MAVRYFAKRVIKKVGGGMERMPHCDALGVMQPHVKL